MSALRECPFCGGTEGQFATDAHSPNYTGKWGWWECSCGARAEDVRTGYDATGWQDAAIAAWNRRCPPAEVDALRAEVARLREALTDMLSGWRYIRQNHGDLYGVGWDRCEDAARAALATEVPDA